MMSSAPCTAFADSCSARSSFLNFQICHTHCVNMFLYINKISYVQESSITVPFFCRRGREELWYYFVWDNNFLLLSKNLNYRRFLTVVNIKLSSMFIYGLFLTHSRLKNYSTYLTLQPLGHRCERYLTVFMNFPIKIIQIRFFITALSVTITNQLYYLVLPM